MNSSSDDQRLSPELSRKVLSAIQDALVEEKTPFWRRGLKALACATSFAAIMALPLLLVFRDQMSAMWFGALGLWWLCLCAGFILYFYPQPRLAVPGFWSPWIFAKLLFAMVFMTALEILLCPSFVFLESPLAWNPFETLSHLFMEWGGMRFCMFACGLIFSGIGGIVSFGVVSRTMDRSSWEDLLKATAVAYLTQIPILAIQLVDAGLRPFAVFWMLGAFAGTLLTATLVRLLRSFGPGTRHRHRES